MNHECHARTAAVVAQLVEPMHDDRRHGLKSHLQLGFFLNYLFRFMSLSRSLCNISCTFKINIQLIDSLRQNKPDMG